MKITVNPDRSVKKEYEENEINDGSQNENRVTTISFEVPEDYSDFTKRIVFITKDGNYFDEIANDEYVLKNNITKYKKLVAFVWLINTTTHQDFRSEVFPLEFNYNENFSDSVPSEQEMSQIEILFERLEDLIEEVESLGSLTREIVEELPTENIDPDVIYMVLREDSEPNNIYDEWMYINNNWEKIGTTDTNLTDYVKNTDYASASVGGVVKIDTNYGIERLSSGIVYAGTTSYANYGIKNEHYFISKGTLENVLNARIGDISTILQELDTGSGV